MLFIKVTQLCTRLSYIMYTLCTSCDCVIVGLQKKQTRFVFLKANLVHINGGCFLTTIPKATQCAYWCK
jgi:hypothetical protein